MSCSGCAIGKGSVKGCSSGGCSTGGCNRLNTYDWLADIVFADNDGVTQFVEVSFKNGARKAFFKNSNHIILEKHDNVAVEAEMGGYDVGTVSLTGEMARLQMKRKRVADNSPDILRVLRIASEYDLKKMLEARDLENATMIRARAVARQLNLNMKVGDVEYQGDARKATFYYIADERVDFRELIKVYAKEFKVKVEMNHIGSRQEAGRIGGIGSCGRELCCSTWLTDFKTVSTSAARYQNLSINQVKLSGQCGRLKCCLNYELDTYLDALQGIPQNIEKLETETGVLYLQKTDIFKRIMWFTYKESTTFHPLSIERVLEIEKMNKEGIKPQDLGAISLDKLSNKPPVEKEPEFTDVVGQTTLESLGKKKKSKSKNRGRDNRDRRDSRNAPQGGNRPQNSGRPDNTSRPANTNRPDNAAKPAGGNRPNNPGRPDGNKPANPSAPRGNQPPQQRRPDNRNRNRDRGPEKKS